MNNPALKALYVSNGIFVCAGAMFVPLYAIFVENIGATIFTISALTSILLVSKIATVLFLQKFGDRFAEKAIFAYWRLCSESDWLDWATLLSNDTCSVCDTSHFRFR